jgi:uncharacterized protein (TIGR03382 family)
MAKCSSAAIWPGPAALIPAGLAIVRQIARRRRWRAA